MENEIVLASRRIRVTRKIKILIHVLHDIIVKFLLTSVNATTPTHSADLTQHQPALSDCTSLLLSELKSDRQCELVQ